MTRRRPEHPDDVCADLTQHEELCLLIRELRPSRIFHLAGLVNEPRDWAQRSSLYSSNVTATASLLEAVLTAGIKPRILIGSSCAVYGSPQRQNGVVSERDPLEPLLDYGVTKAAQELVGLGFMRRSEIEIVIARAFNLIGPGSDRTSVLATVCAQIQSNAERIALGNTHTIRDFLDVRDAAHAYELVARLGRNGGAYNVGSGQGTSVDELVQLAISASGRQIVVQRTEARLRKSDVPKIVADNRALRGLGWTQQYDLKATINHTMMGQQ